MLDRRFRQLSCLKGQRKMEYFEGWKKVQNLKGTEEFHWWEWWIAIA